MHGVWGVRGMKAQRGVQGNASPVPRPSPEHLRRCWLCPPLPSARCRRWVLRPRGGKSPVHSVGRAENTVYRCARLHLRRPHRSEAPPHGGKMAGTWWASNPTLRCPRVSFEILKKKKNKYGGRQRSDPEDAACICSSLQSLD